MSRHRLSDSEGDEENVVKIIKKIENQKQLKGINMECRGRKM